MDELIVEKLTKSFGMVKALNDLDFSASYGEVHAIIGENGAGKSTFIKILSGAVVQDSGRIKLNKKELQLTTPVKAIRAGIGTVYQELSLIPDLDVAQNIYIENWPVKRNIIRKRDLYKHVNILFEKYGVDGIDPAATVRHLPLSQRQIIEVIKAIGKNPRIIIMDEATSALSSAKVEWLLKLCRTFADEKRLVLFISHRMNEIYDGCDRISVFRNGSFVGVRKSNETNDDEIVSMMLGRSLSTFYPVRSANKHSQIVLDVKNLNVKRELKEINFHMYRGEILGMGGLAGQGQAALLLSLFGIKNYRGTVSINGQNVNITHPFVALKNGIVLVPEDRGTQGLILNLSIRENITIANLKSVLSKGFINKRTEKTKTEDIIRSIQIKTNNMEDFVTSLSGGNQQKVVLGKFIFCKPKIMLLFDVTRGVDVGTKMEIYSFMKKQTDEGNCILFYSTDLEELVSLSDRVMVFYDGEISTILEDVAISKENILKASVGSVDL